MSEYGNGTPLRIKNQKSSSERDAEQANKEELIEM